MTLLDSTIGVACIHSDTYNGDTTFVDSSTNNFNVISSATHSTTEAKFGNSSIYSGTTSINDIGFTYLDFWIYPLSGATSDFNIVDITQAGIGITPDSHIILSSDTNGKLTYGYISTVSTTENMNFNSWNHIYINYETTYGDTAYLGLNGVMYSGLANIPSQTTASVSIFSNNAFIDEIRFSSADQITSDYVPYTSAYPILNSHVVSGIVKEGTNLVPRKVRVYNRDTGVFINEGMSDANGIFEVNVPSNDEIYVVCLDDDVGTEYNALIYDRITPTIVS